MIARYFIIHYVLYHPLIPSPLNEDATFYDLVGQICSSGFVHKFMCSSTLLLQFHTHLFTCMRRRIRTLLWRLHRVHWPSTTILSLVWRVRWRHTCHLTGMGDDNVIGIIYVGLETLETYKGIKYAFHHTLYFALRLYAVRFSLNDVAWSELQSPVEVWLKSEVWSFWSSLSDSLHGLASKPCAW